MNVDVVVFVALLIAAHVLGGFLAVRVYRANSRTDEQVGRFLRDAAVCDEADMGERR